MVCKCRDGTYGPHCCKRSRGRRKTSRRNSRKTSRRGGPISARSSGAASRQMNRLGTIIQQAGIAQYANAHLSMPPSSGKIWTPLEKRHVFRKRGVGIGTPDMRKNSRKYDWRPRGSGMDQSRGGPTYEPGQRKLKGREAHWMRRPKYNQGIYSQPTPSEIYHHRKSQKRRGGVKIATGTGLRFLGSGLLVFQLGTYATWLYDDPSYSTVKKIVKDLTLSEQVDEYIVSPIEEQLYRWAPDLRPVVS